MADHTAQTTSTGASVATPICFPAEHDATIIPDAIESNPHPILAVQSPLGDFETPSAQELLHGGFDIACKLFESDAHSVSGHTYESLMHELAHYEEGNPSIDPLQLTSAFVTENPAVPAMVKFGPESPMTQQLMNDSGVAGAREAFYLDGADTTASKFRVDDFVRETVELAVETMVSDNGAFPVTEHQLGSYTVKLVETPDGQLLIAVFNNTGAASATRNPITQESLLQDREREAPGGFGTIRQVYYWTEPLRSSFDTCPPAPATSE